MNLADKQANTAARSWCRRADRRRLMIADYSSELRSWVKHAISQAEEMNDFNKKSKFLSLLKDL